MTRYRAATSGCHYNLEVVGAGETLLLLHGFSGDCSSWDDAIRRLQGEFQVIALDILGHGASDSPADLACYRMSAVAADIISLLDQQGLNRVHLLGYSMGGRLALVLALRYPERFSSLILESASPGLADDMARAERKRRDHELADKIEAHGIEWFVDYWERLPIWESQSRLPKTVLRSQCNQRLRNKPLGLANSLRGMGTGAQPSLRSELTDLKLPALLVAGELDDKFRRTNMCMAESISRAQMAVIASAGHNVHLEQPERFYDLLRSFLKGV